MWRIAPSHVLLHRRGPRPDFDLGGDGLRMAGSGGKQCDGEQQQGRRGERAQEQAAQEGTSAPAPRGG